MVVVIYITLNSMLRLPPRGKLSAKRTDEGKACGSDPLTGNHGKHAPHPASGGASAIFPHRGKAYNQPMLPFISR